MACVIMDPSEPHTHPILPATKASFGIKNMYRECVLAAGVHGTTVRTVDNGEKNKIFFSCNWGSILLTDPSLIQLGQPS